MLKSNPKPRFEFTAGNLALDFANTVNRRPTDRPQELLTDYAALASWARQAGILNPFAYEKLYVQAAQAPGRATNALQEALKLRDAISAIFTAVAARRAVPGNPLAVLNFYVQDSAGHRRLIHTGRRFEWQWLHLDAYLTTMLWPVARAAADLLVSDSIGKVRVCASDTCDWLFIDSSRNHMRRWCDMKSCGNRDKARRHYERAKNE
jgi:predicted RNA-binding Zn ribbon-like protein